MRNKLQVQRHELKFYINQADYEHARSLLKHLMKRDVYQKNKQGYFIRSLYFDDLQNSSVNEKLAGIERRDKYRLRIYDTDQDWAKLERKRKVNNYVQKTSIILSREEAEQIMKGKYDALRKSVSGREIYFDLVSHYYRPAVIVDYIRDAFVLDYNNIRITFDKQLRANDVDLDLFGSEVQTAPLQDDGIIIMEIKFNNFLPGWFQQIFTLQSPVVSAISKYCHSRMFTQDYGL